MAELFKINFFRYFLSASAALFVAIIVNHYVATTEYFLLPLTTLFVMQTSIGSSYYQGMQNNKILLLGCSLREGHYLN